MKINFITCSFLPHHNSGVSVLLLNLSKELIKRGHVISVFSVYTDSKKPKYYFKETIFEGIDCTFINCPKENNTFFHRYKMTDYTNPDLNKIFDDFLYKKQPDIIHFHAIQGIGAGLIDVAVNHKIRTAVTFHDFWWVCANLFLTDHNYDDCSRDCTNCHNQLISLHLKDYKTEKSFYSTRQNYLKKQLKKVDLVFANSKYLQNEIENWNIKNTILNENGIVIPIQKNFKPKKKKNKIVLGFVGGTSELKGYSLVRDAFIELNNPNTELHIYGSHELHTKKLVHSVIRAIVQFKIIQASRNLFNFLTSRKNDSQNHRISYHGMYNENEKYQIFQTFDFVIIGTRVKESFSLVAREASILNIPIITSDCGGAEEVIKEGKNGFIYERNSAKSLKNTILKAIEKRNVLTSSIEEKNTMSIKKQVNQLVSHYSSIHF